MNDYLSTDDLILYVNKSDEIQVKNKNNFKNKNKFKLNKKHIYGSIVILAVLHLVFMAFPLVFKDASKAVLDYQYQIAIKKNQELDEELIGNVVRVKPIDPNNINLGDNVLVGGLYGTDYYWEVEVVEIYPTQQTVDVTFDDVIRQNYAYEDVQGIIGDEANIVGIFYYTASTPRGFAMMIFIHLIVLYAVYYFMFQNQKKSIKGDSNEK